MTKIYPEYLNNSRAKCHSAQKKSILYFRKIIFQPKVGIEQILVHLKLIHLLQHIVFIF